MKIKATDGFWSGGRVIAPDAVVELADADALDAIACGRAVAVDPDAASAANQRIVQSLMQRLGRPGELVARRW